MTGVLVRLPASQAWSLRREPDCAGRQLNGGTYGAHVRRREVRPLPLVKLELVARATMDRPERRTLDRAIRLRADAILLASPAALGRAPATPLVTVRDLHAWYELLEGAESRGVYPARQAAMAEAGRIAVARGQTVLWVLLTESATVAMPHPSSGRDAFTVRPAGGPS
jgi:hypothetical protein